MASANSNKDARTGNIVVKTVSGLSKQVSCVQGGSYTYNYTLNLEITCYNNDSVEDSVTIAQGDFRSGPQLVGYYGGPSYGGIITDGSQLSKTLRGSYTFTDYENASLNFNILDINIEHYFHGISDATCRMYVGTDPNGVSQNANQISNSEYAVTATWNTKFHMVPLTDYYINGFWDIWFE